MEKWNNNAVRQQIEAVIAESYLRCLTEREIREYLRRFLDSCGCAIKGKPGAPSDIRLTGIKVALLRGYFLLNGDERPAPDPAVAPGGKQSVRKIDRERFVEQVVATRSAILRMLDEYNPKMSRTVIRKTGGGRGLRRVLASCVRKRAALLCAGCGAMLVLAAFMVWMFLFR